MKRGSRNLADAEETAGNVDLKFLRDHFVLSCERSANLRPGLQVGGRLKHVIASEDNVQSHFYRAYGNLEPGFERRGPNQNPWRICVTHSGARDYQPGNDAIADDGGGRRPVAAAADYRYCWRIGVAAPGVSDRGANYKTVYDLSRRRGSMR